MPYSAPDYMKHAMPIFPRKGVYLIFGSKIYMQVFEREDCIDLIQKSNLVLSSAIIAKQFEKYSLEGDESGMLSYRRIVGHFSRYLSIHQKQVLLSYKPSVFKPTRQIAAKGRENKDHEDQYTDDSYHAVRQRFIQYSTDGFKNPSPRDDECSGFSSKPEAPIGKAAKCPSFK